MLRPMADEHASTVLNQKYDEFVAAELMVNPNADPNVIVRSVLDHVATYARSVNIAMNPLTEQHFNVLVQQVYQRQIQGLVNAKLQEFIQYFVNEKMPAREATHAAVKQLADWAAQNGYAGVGVMNDEQMEMLVSSVDKIIEKYRTEQEKGAIPVGQGVYADVVHPDDFNERMKKAGLS